jgi:N-carbamoyl-L-amino-acid hydrolase
LEERGVDIGIVEVITGRTTLEIVIEGCACHAGTTPMDHRRDALAAASRVVLAVEALAADGRLRVATVGHISVQPNMRNVVPGRALLGVDLRDSDSVTIDQAVAALDERVQRIAAGTGTNIALRVASSVLPTATDVALTSALETASQECGASTWRMPSGAGHDAQVVAAHVPVAMLFVPSKSGVSHAPAEHTADDDLVRGADVLLASVVKLLDLDPADKGDCL